MAKILAPFVALMSLLVTISAKPGGGDPAYSCRGHEGERECGASLSLSPLPHFLTYETDTNTLDSR